MAFVKLSIKGVELPAFVYLNECSFHIKGIYTYVMISFPAYSCVFGSCRVMSHHICVCSDSFLDNLIICVTKDVLI